MAKLKLVGEFECHKCKGIIDMNEIIVEYNSIGKRCPHCDALNIVRVSVNVDEIRQAREDEIKRLKEKRGI